ncbi:hypothetical protein PsYK624_099310 [Phanerochaete sordida]|uniref:Uncharacterized protein n=1 Tax=Phanerochaete sordida TaxID=48140 RepID=A0A9P3GF95_9APHY|nr:hypothetical protein PsYK624_099310 [Phanerochaete sordida]
MHLLLSSSSGVEILVMEEIHHAGLNVLRQVWHMAQPDPSQVEDFLPAPLFGRQPSAISWLSYPFHGQRLVAFHFAQFAGRRWGSAELRGPETFMVRDDAVPALYYLPVRDYDEGRGVGVFANGYGEVAVCSVSGTDLQKLRQCFETLTLGPPQAAWERLPTTAVSSSIVPPHPCYLTTALDPVHERAQLWAAHTPAHIPDGFRVDWELDYDAGVWNMFTPYPFAPGWRLEHAYKILGRAIPLFRDPGETFFSAGGCFYMLNEEDDVLYAVPPGTPYEELVRIALRPHGERGLVVMEGDGVMEWCADLFYKMVVYDREVLGRDRGEEMRARLQT